MCDVSKEEGDVHGDTSTGKVLLPSRGAVDQRGSQEPSGQLS